MKNRPWHVVAILVSALVLALAWVGVQSDNSAHASKTAPKASCTFSQNEFDAWLSEYGNSYHDSNYAGWGDSLGRVQDVFANCVGTWGQLVTPGGNCNLTGFLQWRVWQQSDGDEVWIIFKDRGVGADPRYIAKCQAGTRKSDNTWRYHFWESHL